MKVAVREGGAPIDDADCKSDKKVETSVVRLELDDVPDDDTSEVSCRRSVESWPSGSVLLVPVEPVSLAMEELDGSPPMLLIICIMKADIALDIMLPLGSIVGIDVEALEPELPCSPPSWLLELFCIRSR